MCVKEMAGPEPIFSLAADLWETGFVSDAARLAKGDAETCLYQRVAKGQSGVRRA